MPVVAGTRYAQQADLANLGLIGGALATIPGATQNAALDAASAVVDSYLQSRYHLPLTQWGQDLVRATCCIAAYDLMSSRGYSPVGASDVNIRQRYLDVLEWLQEVSKGLQTPLSIIDSSTTPGAGSDGSISSESPGDFQMVTSPVRGWTPRGGSNPGDTGGWGCL